MTTPPTEDELDQAATALIPKLNRLANLELEEHTFDSKPDTEHREAQALRYSVPDTLALTDTVEVRVTHEFAPRWCALDHNERARVDPVVAILELYPGNAGRVELNLCPGHHANLLDTYRRRSLDAKTPELHFAGRRIIALNPRPLDVTDVLKSGGAPHETPPPSDN